MTERLRSDVNVGGPDGFVPGADPLATFGSVSVAWDGDESRAWLWDQLNEVRIRYEQRYDPAAAPVEDVEL